MRLASYATSAITRAQALPQHVTAIGLLIGKDDRKTMPMKAIVMAGTPGRIRANALASDPKALSSSTP